MPRPHPPAVMAISLCAWLSLCLPAAAAAQRRDSLRADTTLFRVGEIVVQAVRPITTVGGASAIEIPIQSLSLRPAPLLEEVLREIPMLRVRTNSRGEAELSVRGSESRQVAVLVDGVPLTLGWDARTDVSVVPATAPQQISFIRGLSSMLYGPNVLGGIVEVGVGRAAEQPQRSLQFAAGFDDVGGYGASGTATVPWTSARGHWSMRAGAGYRRSPGAPLARGVVEPVPDDGLRLNTDVDHADAFVALRYRADGGWWFALSSSGFRAERGVAAELGVDNARFWRYPRVARLIAIASGGTGDRASPFGGRGDLEASLGLDIGRTDLDTYASRDYDNVVGFEDGDDRTITLRVLGDHTIAARGELRGAFTYADIHHDERLPSGQATYRQRLWSLGGETVWRVQAGSSLLRLSAGGALDAADTPESGGRPPLGRLTDWGARVGLTASVNGGRTAIHAGASRRGRFPALRELYSVAIDRFEPNPDLEAEHLVALEAGVTSRIGNGGEAQVVIFHHRLSDAIVRVSLPNRKFQRVNRDQIRSTGVELLASHTIGDVTVGADFTLQSVDVIDPAINSTNRPENLPEQFGSAYVRFPVAFDAAARVEIRHTGQQFCIDPGTGRDTRLDAGTHINADLSREWRIRAATGLLSRLETRISADNMADAAAYDQCGLPQPGRLLRVQIRLF